ncbi:hypothetical protein [Micromonospora chokoriensis]|uniref:hypothetical protein n=1 Tax=Micromonospora chokoriensis TaxID=356851 RepID=UPI0012FCDA93|nr:hypothetical protein [Micromonospora chokoriensis]
MSSPGQDVPAAAPALLTAGPGPADVRISQRAADAAVVESERLHQRRLQAAWLHGSTRTAADRLTVWPWALVGLLVTILIVAGMGIASAFRAQQRLDEEQRRRVSSDVIRVDTARQCSAICN